MNASMQPTAHNTSAPQAMTPGRGLMMLVAIVLVVGAYLALAHGLGISEVWGAFLFLLYWAGIEHAAVKKLPACTIGAAAGLLMGFLLKMLPLWLGDTGMLVFLGAVLILIYFQVMGWLPVAVNMVTMLYLTVTTIPIIQSDTSFGAVFIALISGVVYFGGLVLAGHWWRKRTGG